MQRKRPSTPPVRQEHGYCNPDCEWPSLETRALHKCRKTLSWAHSICCVEVKVNREWVIVDDSDKSPTKFSGKRFPASLLPDDSRAAGARDENGDDNWAWSGFSEICLGCLPTLIERGRALAKSTRDSTLDREASPSVQQLALFEAVYPETNSEALAQLTAHDVEEALYNTKEGNSGPARRTAYEVAVADSSRSCNQCPIAPGKRLKEIRLNFTPDGLLKHSKATSTFDKHQGYNERFILYLYKKSPELLDPGFARAMDDVDADIDYSTVEAGHRKYKRYGKKTLSNER
jgi:hypothetical protein